MIRRILIILVFILVLLVGMFIRKAEAEAPLVQIPTDPIGQIAYYAAIFNVNPTEMVKVGMCESNLSMAIGDNGKAYFWFQYHVPTWNSFAKQFQKEFGGELLKIEVQEDQVQMTAWAFSKGYQYHWTCKGV